MKQRTLIPEESKLRTKIILISLSSIVFAALYTGLYYFAFKSIDPIFISTSILFVLLPFILITAAVKTNKRYFMLISIPLVIIFDVIEMLCSAGLLRPEFHFDMLLYIWPIAAELLVILTLVRIIRVKIIAIFSIFLLVILEAYGIVNNFISYIKSEIQFFDCIVSLFGFLAWFMSYIALIMIIKEMALKKPKKWTPV